MKKFLLEFAHKCESEIHNYEQIQAVFFHIDCFFAFIMRLSIQYQVLIGAEDHQGLLHDPSFKRAT